MCAVQRRTRKYYRNPPREACCDSKRGYKRKWDASKVELIMRKRTKQSFDIYKCPYCKLWHIGRKWPQLFQRVGTFEDIAEDF